MAFVFTPEGTARTDGESMFKAEQQVSYKGMGMPATIISGPHKTYGADRWLVRKADGMVTLAKAGELSALPDRREKVAAVAYKGATGYPFTEAGSVSREKYLRIADAVLAVLDVADKSRPLAAGDHIRILKSRLEFATVLKGDELKVQSVDIDGGSFHTDAPRATLPREFWSFYLRGEGTGWERI